MQLGKWETDADYREQYKTHTCTHTLSPDAKKVPLHCIGEIMAFSASGTRQIGYLYEI